RRYLAHPVWRRASARPCRLKPAPTCIPSSNVYSAWKKSSAPSRRSWAYSAVGAHAQKREHALRLMAVHGLQLRIAGVIVDVRSEAEAVGRLAEDVEDVAECEMGGAMRIEIEDAGQAVDGFEARRDRISCAPQ